MTIAVRYRHIHQVLAGEVRLMAVCKRQSVERVCAAHRAGCRDFGDNYLQDYERRLPEVPADIRKHSRWHFIGALQSRKIRRIAKHFDWVHTASTASECEALNTHRAAQCARPLNVCLQVNIAGEQGKQGMPPTHLEEMLDVVATCPHLRLRGLMALPPLSASASPEPHWYALAYTHYQAMRAQVSTVDTLSLGTSADWRVAVAHGATMIRLGTALLGARP